MEKYLNAVIQEDNIYLISSRELSEGETKDNIIEELIGAVLNLQDETIETDMFLPDEEPESDYVINQRNGDKYKILIYEFDFNDNIDLGIQLVQNDELKYDKEYQLKILCATDIEYAKFKKLIDAGKIEETILFMIELDEKITERNRVAKLSS